MSIKKIASISGVLALIAASLLADTSANAAGNDTIVDRIQIDAPLNISGYDTEIAEKNGFQIVIGEDGIPTSIPVTPRLTKS